MPEAKDIRHPKTLKEALHNIREANGYNQYSVELIVGLFSKIRPMFYGNYQKAENSLNELIQILENDPATLRKLRYLLTQIIARSEILETFTSSGIETDANFFIEFRNRLKHKILPPSRKKESLLRIIDTIFYKNTDIRWVEKIVPETWERFFTLLKLQVNFADKEMLSKLNQSLHIVSCRIVTLSMNKEVRGWLTSDETALFVDQNRLSQNIIDFYEHAPVVEQKYTFIKSRLKRTLKHCEDAVLRMKTQSASIGTSLQQSYLLKQIRELIARMHIILDIANREDMAGSRLVYLFQGIILNENTKNSISLLISSSIKVLAYRVAEHEHDTGEHYITTSRKEYTSMLFSAMRGGLIAALIALVKTFLHKIVMAPFWQAFAYSLNYAGGFVTIHLTGSTLATKQPAMTASSIASAMDTKGSGKKSHMSDLAILLSKVWRSQTASFIGNLGIAFPVALGVAALYFLIFKINIVEGVRAQELLDWQNPLKSHCLLYACNTGVFLYLSGLVTGFFDNRVIHGKIPQRIDEHPFLLRFFSQKSIRKISSFVDKNLGPIIGNVFLGFCLGMAGFFGNIFGIDFDIRHITISTGQFAIGLQGLGYQVGTLDLIMTITGILFIGFLNFLVSFSLAFITASISRGIRFTEYRYLFTYLRRLLFRYPLDFVIPPKNGRAPEDLRRKTDKVS